MRLFTVTAHYTFRLIAVVTSVPSAAVPGGLLLCIGWSSLYLFFN